MTMTNTTQNIKTTSNLLFNEEPLVINKMAARVLGLNEAIVLQQIHYWIDINRKAKINFHDERTWTYNTYESWQKENFDFWSIATLKRIFKNLFDKEILLKGNYNLHKYDRKLWVSINYDKLDNLLAEYNSKNIENVEISTKCQFDTMSNCNIVSNCDYGKYQSDTMESVNLTPPIAETNTEITTETPFTTQSEDKPPVVDTNKELVESNTHLLLDSDNKIKKVNSWNKDRLLKAIEIFKQREGQYFTLLEKIYKDDKNFVPKSEGSSAPKVVTRFHNITDRVKDYAPDELEKLLKENQKDKFNTDNKKEIDINVIREKAIDILQARINADDTILFKANVRNNIKSFENEINEICNELLKEYK